MKVRVVGNGSESEPFDIMNSTKQGCIPALTLFSTVITAMITDALENSGLEGINIHFRTDSSIFNLSWLKAKTKVQLMPIKELLFADDCALVTNMEEGSNA